MIAFNLKIAYVVVQNTRVYLSCSSWVVSALDVREAKATFTVNGGVEGQVLMPSFPNSSLFFPTKIPDVLLLRTITESRPGLGLVPFLKRAVLVLCSDCVGVRAEIPLPLESERFELTSGSPFSSQKRKFGAETRIRRIENPTQNRIYDPTQRLK